MHQDWADETSTKDWKIDWQENLKAFGASKDDDGENEDQDSLNEEDKESRRESIVNLILIQTQLFHGVPVKSFEAHWVGIDFNVQLFVCFFSFFE